MRRYTLTVAGRPFVIDVDTMGESSFRVILDGQSYEVRLESAEEADRPAVTPMVEGFPVRAPDPAPRTVAAVAPAPRLAAPAAARSAADGDVLVAPMPGLVLAVDAAPGQSVRRGDPLLTLEAMKMQNIIRAPADAVVVEVLVSAGQSVGFGEPLVRFDTGAV